METENHIVQGPIEKKSSLSTKILYVIGAILLALLIFRGGIYVGYHRAGFAYGWGENYYKTFGGQRPNMFPAGPKNEPTNANGVAGKIIKISLPTIIVDGADGVEKIILIKSDTAIRYFRDAIKAADLKVGDSVVIIGSPNANSQIEAKLIRVMPEMPAGNMPLIPPPIER